MAFLDDGLLTEDEVLVEVLLDRLNDPAEPWDEANDPESD